MFTLNHTVKPLIIYQDQFCLLIIKLIVLSKERTKGAFQSDFLAATNTEEAQLYQKGNSLHFFHSDLLTYHILNTIYIPIPIKNLPL